MAKVRLPILAGVLVALIGAFGFALYQVTGKPWLALAALGATVFLVAAMLGAYVLVLFLTVGLHELGHYVAGRSVGFRLQTLVAGPLGYRQEAERLVRHRVRPARLYGFVAMVPEGDHDLKSRYRRFILGGPVASLLWCATTCGAWRVSGLPLPLAVPQGSSASVYVASMAMAVLMLGSILMLPGTLLPYRIRRMGGLPTDMMWLILLRRDGDESRRLMASMTLFRLVTSGTLIRDLPVALLAEAALLRDGGVTELNALTLQWAHGIHRDPPSARAALARHREIVEALGPNLIEPWRSSARLVQALDAVFERQDAEAAERWMEGVGEPPMPNLAASAAVARAGIAALNGSRELEKRIEGAARAVEEAARRAPMDYSSEYEQLAALRAGWPAVPLRSSGSA